jgi:hypothetical protein
MSTSVHGAAGRPVTSSTTTASAHNRLVRRGSNVCAGNTNGGDAPVAPPGRQSGHAKLGTGPTRRKVTGHVMRAVARQVGRPRGKLSVLVAAATVCAGAAAPASAQVTELVLLNVGNTGSGYPVAPLLADTTGAAGSLRGLFGTTSGYGSVFRLTPPKEGQTIWKERIFRTFHYKGSGPNTPGYGAPFAFDKRITPDTAIYGTSLFGGEHKNDCVAGYGYNGCGMVFSVTGHQLTKVWQFTGGNDGGQPYEAVIADKSGALYTGTDYGGGASSCGTVVKLTPPAQGQTAWTETTIWTFTNGNDGCLPMGLIFDKAGALYGEALQGGGTNNGTVFRLVPPMQGQSAWTEQTLWSFQGGSDGSEPYGPPTAGKNGVIYGTTSAGGSSGNGTVFALSPPRQGAKAWGEQILWNFTGGADGGAPYAPVTVDHAGALYGTAFGGGTCCGTVFKLTPPENGQTAWTESTLWQFSGGADGGNPTAAPIADKQGILYDTTDNGGSVGAGVVFSLAGTGFVPK